MRAVRLSAIALAVSLPLSATALQAQTAEPEATPPSLPAPDSAAPAPEAGASDAAAATPDQTPAQRLDQLFADLKRESDPDKAQVVATKIQAEWSRSGSATVDLLMLWAGQAMSDKEGASALDLLDQAILLEPGYAEAWNRRATLHFTRDEFGKSLADIERTLALEPRHFGALLGLATILEQTDRKQKALETYMRVLAIYPALRSAQEAVGRLADDLSGQPI
ncbi:hypothetical protein NPA31_014770 [Aurantimonas sp. MSK8Z-1]|uniref:hypothetical protein n=1 Tax=Mangrovibrevibacter kandeliae TaxID=2968473 RepID=UPI0021182AE5|nr:hypothetical protein [Aurantimonas sp. MSK8Z-1]MCW4116226.1 hypothetical protein [Aurantimonas sp. MSK8Z-1]